MATSAKSKESSSEKTSTANSDEVLRPFQEASAKYLQARLAAQEVVLKQRAQACLDLQDRIREVEQEAYRALMEVSRKHVAKIGQQPAGNFSELYLTRAQSQLDYEKEVRQVYMDSHAKLSAIAQTAAGEHSGEAIKSFTDQQQNAYQAYLADLQRAWSAAKSLDPQTMSVIASNIMFTMQAS